MIRSAQRAPMLKVLHADLDSNFFENIERLIYLTIQITKPDNKAGVGGLRGSERVG